MNRELSRRAFLRSSSTALAGVCLGGCVTGSPRRFSANEKLNVAVIGTANRARSNIAGVREENIVALCDIDEHFLEQAAEQFPGASRHTDFRKMLEQKDIDAVIVSTADHCHAVATAAALHSGRHVYCEKPLAHTVHEARAIARAAARHPQLATQMGTQIHATENYRRVVELIQSGSIGPVRECHVWCEKSLSASERPTPMPPVPKHIHWDLWLGPAPARPYHPAYLPKTWRHWWDFGEGILGDMACHFMDLPFWALGLRAPTTVEAEGPPVHPETTPEWLIVKYQFPKRHGLPAVKLTWYDGGKRPALVRDERVPAWRDGVLFVGDKGMLLADYTRRKLLPEVNFGDFQPPSPWIAPSAGHHKEWLNTCKTGSPTSCNFAYGSALTETVLLGNVAFRAGIPLEWDSAAARVTNTRQAGNYLQKEYRRGWNLG